MKRSRLFTAVAVLCLAASIATAAASPAIELKAVQERFANAKVVMDAKTMIPSRITGLNYRPKVLAGIKTPLEEKQVDTFFKAFVDENRQVLSIDTKDLRIVSKIKRKGKWYVRYQQLYEGLPVIDGTVGMIGTERGEVLNYTASFHPGITIDIKEDITEERAAAIAKETYDGALADKLTIRKIEKVVIAPDEKSGQSYRLVWRVDVTASIDRVENDKIFLIDAKTGVILKQYPSRFYGSHAFGTVRGEIYPENPTDAVVTEPLAYEWLRGNGTFWNKSTNTNAAGDWDIDTPWWTGMFKSYTATFMLRGQYAHVMDNAGNEYTETDRCRCGSRCDFTWTDADRDHINVFYHINVLHDWYVDHLGYSWTNSWDNTARFNAEVNHAYANAHAGDPMGFGTNNYSRSSDVVYHECSHNVLHELYGDYVGFPAMNDESYAFDEGFADYFANAITEDGLHGEGVGGGRDHAATPGSQYTDKATYNIEGHAGGLIIGGAAWNIREEMQDRIGDAAGASLVDNLMFDAHVAMATMPRDYYFSDPQESNFLSALYIADDDNNNLLDGVPHFFVIQNAFATHNLLQAELLNRDSYDVSTNTLGTLTGGDFYFSGNAFWSNNAGQRGVQDLGDIGAVDLEDVGIPITGYTRQRVDAVEDHTYVALAQTGEEGNYIVFRVNDLDAANNTVVIQYRYRSLMLVDPRHICERFPHLCGQIFPCIKYPFLCHRHVVIPFDEGLIIEFLDELDRVVVPVDRICRYVLDCPGCGPAGYCPGYDMMFEDMTADFGLTVYDSHGEVVAEDLSRSTTKRLKFETEKKTEYFLVVSPPRGCKIGEQYRLGMEVKALDTDHAIR